MTARQVAALPLHRTTGPLPVCTSRVKADVTNGTSTTQIRASDPDQVVTLVRGDVLTVLADTLRPQPAFAAKSPFCQDEGVDGTVVFVAVRSGDTSVYFVGQHGVTTDQIDVETPPSDARLLAFPFGVALLLAGLFGLAMRFRQQYSIGPQDLQRADQAQGGDAYDPERANRTAFDVFDQHSRP